MSKLCDRDYSGATILTIRMIDGIGSCPSCQQPAQMHGKSVSERALFWALAMDTGVSSKAIAKHMTGYSSEQPFGFMPPSDSSDRHRCIRLLSLVPEWIPRLKELVKYDAPKGEGGIVINSSGISSDTNTWQKQIPLILMEGKL